jgi:hypothetical protein
VTARQIGQKAPYPVDVEAGKTYSKHGRSPIFRSTRDGIAVFLRSTRHARCGQPRWLRENAGRQETSLAARRLNQRNSQLVIIRCKFTGYMHVSGVA